MTTIQQQFIRFVTAREEARITKEMLGGAPPYTDDPVIGQFRFCNVNREHDAVTKWVKANVRDRFTVGDTLADMVFQLYIARIFNEPTVLKHIMPVKRLDTMVKVLKEIKAGGHKVLRGAYLCVPHGTENGGVAVEDYFAEVAGGLRKAKWPKSVDTLEQVANTMLTVDGVGDFIANQVCTDLRYVPIVGNVWGDWETFVLAGPGTRRGLNRYQGADGGNNRRFPKLFGDCAPLLLQVRKDVKPHLPPEVWDHFRDINNLSNCFCEFDKYMRGLGQLADSSRLTLRRYNKN